MSHRTKHNHNQCRNFPEEFVLQQSLRNALLDVGELHEMLYHLWTKEKGLHYCDICEQIAEYFMGNFTRRKGNKRNPKKAIKKARAYPYPKKKKKKVDARS